jgi:hypothetical protein
MVLLSLFSFLFHEGNFKGNTKRETRTHLDIYNILDRSSNSHCSRPALRLSASLCRALHLR